MQSSVVIQEDGSRCIGLSSIEKLEVSDPAFNVEAVPEAFEDASKPLLAQEAKIPWVLSCIMSKIPTDSLNQALERFFVYMESKIIDQSSMIRKADTW